LVEFIQTEGVELEKRPTGAGTKAVGPIIDEVDSTDCSKDVDILEIDI
jgi:type III restriction enzyme